MAVVFPANLKKIAEGRDHIRTSEYGRYIGRESQTIRKLYRLNGHAFGIRPVKIGNRLLWPVDKIAELLTGAK